MQTYKTLVAETKNTLELESLLEVYEELAATKMQKIRSEILNSREFYEGLTTLVDEVGSDVSEAVKTTDKEAAVFVSANAGLYGEIIEKTFSNFMSFIKKMPQLDLFIIGRNGNTLMKEYGKGYTFQTIDLPDDKVEEKMLAEIIVKLLRYKKLFIFYGKFKDVAIQNPYMARVPGELLPKTGEKLELIKKKRLQYLYEPALSHISTIFAQELFASLFEKMLEEASLARLGSRLMHLDSSLEHIAARLKFLTNDRRKVQKASLDKKQNDMISSVLVRM